MTDQAFTDGPDTGQRNFESADRTAKSTADQVLSAGRELRDKATDFASSSGESIREQASEFVDTAKQVGADAVDRLGETIDTQKDAGARYVGGIAEAMRRAAHEFDNDLPIAGTGLRHAASQVDAVSDSVRNGHFSDLLNETRDFARRQPTAFLGMTVLAGFGLVRLLKSSNQNPSSRGSGRYSSGRGSEVSQSVSEDRSERVVQGLKR